MRPVPPLAPLHPLLAETCQSWDVATRAHNSHKASQGAWLQTGSTLFEEEVELLGDIDGKTLLHACCNSGQDTISLNLRHGAHCTGVDFSGEAIATARALAEESRASVLFLQDELLHYLETTESRFDLAFGSYGFLPWIHDLPSLARGFSRVLHPGSRLVLLEFHPLAWSFDQDYRLQDPYFAPGRFFSEPVSDYVAAAEGALSPSGHVDGDGSYVNPHRAHSVQHTVADIVSAFLKEGFRLETFREWPWSNGCRIHAGLVPKGTSGMDARRFTTPAHVPNLPWMLGLSLRRT